jgi:hypothetical protein
MEKYITNKYESHYVIKSHTPMLKHKYSNNNNDYLSMSKH